MLVQSPPRSKQSRLAPSPLFSPTFASLHKATEFKISRASSRTRTTPARHATQCRQEGQEQQIIIPSIQKIHANSRACTQFVTLDPRCGHDRNDWSQLESRCDQSVRQWSQLESNCDRLLRLWSRLDSSCDQTLRSDSQLDPGHDDIRKALALHPLATTACSPLIAGWHEAPYLLPNYRRLARSPDFFQRAGSRQARDI